MTDRPIEESGDADLQGLEPALQRAAQQARARARATGTRLVLSRNGVLVFLSPERLARNSQEVAESPGQYGSHE